MLRVFGATIGLVCAVFIGFCGGLLLNVDSPSTVDLDQDIAKIRNDVEAAKIDATRYGDGSIIRSQIDFRIQTLNSTMAALEQKRLSMLRLIRIEYKVDGTLPKTPSNDEIESINKEIADGIAAARAAEQKASAYAGGLFKTLHEMEALSHQARVAVLQQHLTLVRLGVTRPESRPTLPPIGRAANDRGAL